MSSLNPKSTVGLILLAAGASTRMGSPKQLLTFNGETLIQLAVKTALRSQAFPVVVVVGAHKELVKLEIANMPAFLVENPDWEEGMGSSIRVGLEMIMQTYEAVEGVIIMLCDQPFVTTTYVNELITQFKNTKLPIVASKYKNTTGVPALFNRALFPELEALSGPEGAHKLIMAYQEELLSLPFPEGAVDIDTPADYLDLQTHNSAEDIIP